MLPPVHVIMDKLQHIAVESKLHGGPLPKLSGPDDKAVYSLALSVRDPECSNVALRLGKTSRPDWY